jgi:hypothetical protein
MIVGMLMGNEKLIKPIIAQFSEYPLSNQASHTKYAEMNEPIHHTRFKTKRTTTFL